MQLSNEAVREFKDLYEKEFDEVLSDDEARARAQSFMRLVLILIRPLPDGSPAPLPGSVDYNRSSGRINPNPFTT